MDCTFNYFLAKEPTPGGLGKGYDLTNISNVEFVMYFVQIFLPILINRFKISGNEMTVWKYFFIFRAFLALS